MVRVLQRLLGAVLVVLLLGLAALGQNGELSEDISDPLKVIIHQLFQTALAEQNYNVREAIAQAIKEADPQGAFAFPELVDVLDVLKERQYDNKLVWALFLVEKYDFGEQAELAEDIVPKLIPLLDSENSNVRRAAAAALGKIGPAAQKAVPKLIKLLGDYYVHVRQSAAEALGNIGPAAQKAVPKLIKLLGDSDWGVQELAAEALEKIGPAAKDDIGELIELLGDSDSDVRRAAAEALGELGPDAKTAVDELTTLLEDEYQCARIAAVEALGKIGPAAKGAVGDLIKLLGDSDSDVRRAAAEALGNIGLDARAAVPKLAELLGDSYSDVRRAAATALVQIYRPQEACSREVADALIRHKDDKDPEVREAVRSAWLAASSCFIDEEVTKYLAIILSIPDPVLRKRAIDMLGWIGPAANPKAVAPLLEVLKTNPGPEIRAAAAKALAKILAPQD